MRTYLALLIILSSCSQKNESCISINEPLPDEIILNDNTREIIDSTFIYKGDTKQLSQVSNYKIENSLLESKKTQYFENNELKSTYIYKCGTCGNVVKEQRIVNNIPQYQNVKKRDKHGSVTQSETTEKNITSTLYIQNEYKSGHLVKTITTNSNNSIIETSTYKFDTHGNKVETISDWAILGKTKSILKYNKDNKLYEAITISNVEEQRTLYYYNKNGFLSKEVSNGPHGNIDTDFFYDENNLLVRESGYSDYLYSDFDQYGNWHKRKIMFSGIIQQELTRTYLYTKH